MENIFYQKNNINKHSRGYKLIYPSPGGSHVHPNTALSSLESFHIIQPLCNYSTQNLAHLIYTAE